MLNTALQEVAEWVDDASTMYAPRLMTSSSCTKGYNVSHIQENVLKLYSNIPCKASEHVMPSIARS